MKKEKSEVFFRSYHPSLQKINGIHFTNREIDILAFLVSARPHKVIASYLSISLKTVDNHTRNIRDKINCNATNGVIDFCENSGVDNLLREHYANLFDSVAFEKSLQRIAKIHPGTIFSCLLICFDEKQAHDPFVSQLKTHLQLAGISAFLKIQESSTSLYQLRGQAHQDEFIIYIVPQDKVEKLGGLYREHKNSLPQPPQKNDRVLFLCPAAENLQGSNKDLPHLPYNNFIEHKIYYDLYFQILEKIFTSPDWKKFIPQFKEYNESVQRNFIPHPSQTDLEKKIPSYKKEKNDLASYINLKNKRFIFSFSTIIIVLLIAFPSYQFFSSGRQENPIRSDLNLPADSVLLDRSELIYQLDKKFITQKHGGINVVALVGIGGAGKTTLARQYAHQQNAPAIWEVNAETPESLKSSFEKFARYLVHSEEDKKILREIEEIKKSAEKEEKILLFVQERLRLHPNWLLIYDNVKQFMDVQKSFPQDVKLWGHGKVLLTTQNTNIQNNSLINNVLHVGELSPEQKLNLFRKIMNHGSSHPFRETSSVKTLEFLKNIPPFPLDVSVAAYYLKSTPIPYKKYLENLESYNKEFTNVQENLLKEAGTYLKTRYSIITLSLEHLLQSHKDFADLALFISLLDSQNIPRDLLNRYNNHSIVDNFIYHLKKYSLITNDSLNSVADQVFSIHRSTQAITLAYMLKKLNLEKGDKRIQRLSNTLIDYAMIAIEADDFPKLQNLMSQYQAFLNYENLLTTDIEASLKCTLGSIYGFLYDIIKAKKLIEENFPGLDKNYKVMPQALTSLGIAEKELGNHEKAKNLLEKSVSIYKNHLSENDVSFARTIVDLGEVYRLLEEIEKAKIYLEKGVTLYKNLPQNELGLARAFKYLALLHRTLGEYEKSKDLLEQSLQVYRKKYSNHHVGVAQILAHLGNVYKKLGNDEKAKDFLEESHSVFKRLFSTNHAKVAWISLHLGDAYWRLGQYEKAQHIFEESLTTYKKLYPIGNDWIAKVSLKLGEVENKLGYKEKARALFKSGLKIQEENTSEINLQKIQYLHQLGDFYNNLENYEQAKLAYTQCLAIYDKNFGKYDPRASAKIRLKLGEAYKNLGDYIQSENTFAEVFTIYKKYYGENHLRTAQVLFTLGQLYLLKSELNLAEAYLTKALKIFEKDRSPDLYIVLEDLSKVYQTKATEAQKQNQQAQAQQLKAQSLDYLKQALDNIKRHFPSDSPHIQRIQLKLSNLTEGM